MKNNTQQKGRRGEKELAQKMYELAQAGRSGLEIMSELDIPRPRAEYLHYTLMRAGKLSMESLSFSRPDMASVRERGLFIPRSRFTALGLDTTFPAGTPVRFCVRGNSLVVEPVNTGSTQVQKETVRSGPLLPDLLDNPFADEIAMGDSDEPNA